MPMLILEFSHMPLIVMVEVKKLWNNAIKLQSKMALTILAHSYMDNAGMDLMFNTISMVPQLAVQMAMEEL